jgi:hypothetical protein
MIGNRRLHGDSNRAATADRESENESDFAKKVACSI